MPRQTACVVVAALGLLASPRSARADNTEPFFYSDDAAMTGGTVVAPTRDAGAIWYNPAGLGGIRRGQIDLSGSAFGIRIRRVPDALGTNLPGGRQSVTLDSADIFSAPHAIGLVRNVSDSVALGFGFYVTARDVRTSQNQLEVSGPSIGNAAETARYRQRLDLAIDETRYHFGPAIGWEIAEGFRIGAALFGTYGKKNGFSQYVIDAEADGDAGPSRLDALVQGRVAFSYFGTQAQVGAQWEPAPGWDLGLLVRSPEFLLTASSEGAGITSSAVVAPGRTPTATFALQGPDISYPAFTIIAPLRSILGVAYHFGPRTWVSAEVDVQAPFSNEGIEQTTVINGRTGVRFRISDKLGAGFGLFSDRATQARLGDEFTDERVDAYGATAGIELRTPLSLTEHAEPEALVLSTTLAIKYAIGIGSVRAADIDLVDTTTPVPPRSVDVIYHTILPYIGSGILF
ncbi:MAG: hypothetical protein JWP87_6515 [Labilithrix sp.]|nr:hypothetical protein [Labilithrix sp.]